MVYSWKAYGYSVSAETVGKEFEKIEKQYGKLTSDLVLQSAEDENSPIHECFEWDDAVAGHKYRLSQATSLILNLAVEPDKVKKPEKIRAYYNVSDSTKKGTFINAKSAFENPDTRDIVLKRALREFKAFQEKYKNLSEFSQIFGMFDELSEKYEIEAEEEEHNAGI